MCGIQIHPQIVTGFDGQDKVVASMMGNNNNNYNRTHETSTITRAFRTNPKKVVCTNSDG